MRRLVDLLLAEAGVVVAATGEVGHDGLHAPLRLPVLLLPRMHRLALVSSQMTWRSMLARQRRRIFTLYCPIMVSDGARLTDKLLFH